MFEIKVINGEIHSDARGFISSLNSFRFDDVQRVYFIHHPDTSVVRGWHAHQFEKKWYYCVKGQFSMAFVKIDNWENPSPDLKPEIFELSEEKSEILCIPPGYANCLKTSIPGSVLLVFSSKVMPDALEDSWRYPNTMWVYWAK